MNQLKGDIRPILFRFGVALALSFTGFLYSRIRSRRVKPLLPPPPSPTDSGHDNANEVRSESDDINIFSATSHRITISSTARENDEIYHRSRSVVIGNSLAAPKSPSNGFLLPEISAVVKELDFSQTPRSDIETPKSFITVDKDTYEEEIEQLKNTVQMLQERERNLKARLLEYYGLKEEEAAAMELQNRLKLKNMEVKLFSLKIDSLKKENGRLEQQVADRAKVVSDLEIARSKIRMLKKKLRSEAEQNREQIVQLQKRVEKLQIVGDVDSGAAEVNLMKLKQLEHDVEELRETNTRLRMENTDLVQRLESTQILANCILEDPQTEALKQETDYLRRENETLTKEVDHLQASHCSDVEELVYLRWINACLRYELRNYEPPSGKTAARDLSKTLSPKSEEKAKQLILEYAEVAPPDKVDFDSDEWSSSRFSDELDVSILSNSSSEKTNGSGKKKKKLFGKLRKLLFGKDIHEENPNPNNKPEPWELVREASSSDSSTGHSSSNMGPSRHSLDIQKLRRLKLENGKDSEHRRRNSDLGSVHHLGRESGSVQMGELAKYAKALKDSWVPKKSKLYKKSASVGSFQSIVR